MRRHRFLFLEVAAAVALMASVTATAFPGEGFYDATRRYIPAIKEAVKEADLDDFAKEVMPRVIGRLDGLLAQDRPDDPDHHLQVIDHLLEIGRYLNGKSRWISEPSIVVLLGYALASPYQPVRDRATQQLMREVPDRYLAPAVVGLAGLKPDLGDDQLRLYLRLCLVEGLEPDPGITAEKPIEALAKTGDEAAVVTLVTQYERANTTEDKSTCLARLRYVADPRLVGCLIASLDDDLVYRQGPSEFQFRTRVLEALAWIFPEEAFLSMALQVINNTAMTEQDRTEEQRITKELNRWCRIHFGMTAFAAEETIWYHRREITKFHKR